MTPFAILFSLLLAAQASPAAVETLHQSPALQVLVPHNWKVARSGDPRVVLEHASGAIFQAALDGRNRTRRSALPQEAERRVEGFWRELGFATVSAPLERRVRGFRAVQYQVTGTRLSERRRASFITVEREDHYLEIVYETGEGHFEQLAVEAERMVESVQLAAEVNEQQAAEVLRAIHGAEIKYFEMHRSFGSLPDLIRSGLLDERLGSPIHGYIFRVSLTRSGYRAEAIPLRRNAGRYAFFTDGGGVIRRSR